MKKYPDTIGNVLDSVLAERGYLSVCREYEVISHWETIVGKTIAAVSTCCRVENGILYVSVKSSSWRQEMSFIKNKILDKIKSETKCNSIKEIVFT